MFYKCFTVVLFIFIQNIAAKSTFRRHRSDSEPKTFSKCIERLGCVDTNEKWFDSYYRPINLEPLERHTIRTEFLLMKQSKNDSKEILYDMLTLRAETVSISGYKKGKITIFLIHDFTSNGHTGWVKHAAFVIEQEMEANVLSVDWEAGAEPPYDQAIANARVVALEIEAMINMLKTHFSLKENNVHLIGHGVGAHIAGYVGKNMKGIYRITALDPTGPRFENMPNLVRLDADDANYVEVLHTEAANSRSQGTREPMGHSDFYLNNADVQPGCNESSNGPRFTEVTRSALREGTILPDCSHKRSFKYYISAITTRECKFIGIACSSYEAYVNGTCSDCDTHMCSTFDMCPPPKNMNKYTKFFLHTNSDFPYCMHGYQVNISIEQNPNARKADGYFEFIFMDANNKITFAMGKQFGTTKRTYVPGNTYTLMIHAPPPSITKMKEAKVRWRASTGLMLTKKPIYVKYIAVRRIPIMSEILPMNGMCPEAGTEIKDGAYIQFVSCDTAIVQEKERIATMTTTPKPETATTTITQTTTILASTTISNITISSPAPLLSSTTTIKPTIQCLQPATAQGGINVTTESNRTLGGYETAVTTLQIAVTNKTFEESTRHSITESEVLDTGRVITEEIKEATILTTFVNPNIVSSTRKEEEEEYDEYDYEADYIPETTTMGPTNNVSTIRTNANSIDIKASTMTIKATVRNEIIETIEEETELTTMALHSTKKITGNVKETDTEEKEEEEEEAKVSINFTTGKSIPAEEEEENEAEVTTGSPLSAIKVDTLPEILKYIGKSTIPTEKGKEEEEEEEKEETEEVTQHVTTKNVIITEKANTESLEEKSSSIFEISSINAKTEEEKGVTEKESIESTTRTLAEETTVKTTIEEKLALAATNSIGNYSIFQENEILEVSNSNDITEGSAHISSVSKFSTLHEKETSMGHSEIVEEATETSVGEKLTAVVGTTIAITEREQSNETSIVDILTNVAEIDVDATTSIAATKEERTTLISYQISTEEAEETTQLVAEIAVDITTSITKANEEKSTLVNYYSATEIAEEKSEIATHTEQHEIGLPKLSKVNGTNIVAEEIEIGPRIGMGKAKVGSDFSILLTTVEDEDNISKASITEVQTPSSTASADNEKELVFKLTPSKIKQTLTTMLIAEEERMNETEFATTNVEATTSVSTGEEEKIEAELPISKVEIMQTETETKETELKIETILHQVTTSVSPIEEKETEIHLSSTRAELIQTETQPTLTYEETEENEDEETLATTQPRSKTEEIEPKIETILHQVTTPVASIEEKETDIQISSTRVKLTQTVSLAETQPTLTYEESEENEDEKTNGTTENEKIAVEVEDTEIKLTSTRVHIVQIEQPTEKEEILKLTTSVSAHSQTESEETESNIITEHKEIIEEEQTTEINLIHTKQQTELPKVLNLSTLGLVDEVAMETKAEIITAQEDNVLKMVADEGEENEETKLQSTSVPTGQTKELLPTPVTEIKETETETETEQETETTMSSTKAHTIHKKRKKKKKPTTAQQVETTILEVRSVETTPLPDEDITCDETSAIGEIGILPTTHQVTIANVLAQKASKTNTISMVPTLSVTASDDLPECDEVEE